jgi:Predicted membrane protein (DUF2306)
MIVARDRRLPLESLQTNKEGTEESFFRWMYIAVTLLSVYMVVLILIFPSSWLGGRSSRHDDLIRQLIPADGISPPEIVDKYAGHTAVHLTHTLPGSIWAGLIPFQLHPSFRRQRPTLHRWSGYVFLACALVMAVGIGIILHRKLLFVNFFPELPPENLPTEYIISALGIYFVISILNAVRLAVRRQFAAHQRWIVRHVSSGIWVALQRVLITTVYSVMHSAPVSRATQRQVFGDAAVNAIVTSLVLGEVSVFLLTNRTKKLVD